MNTRTIAALSLILIAVLTTSVVQATESTVAVEQNQTTPATPLFGIWYLKLMSEQNGTALDQTISPEVTLIFGDSSTISGDSGCNTYEGTYTLTGKTLTNGEGITINPLNTTHKGCTDKSSEKTYLQIFQGSTSYLVNANQELSLMDEAGDTLVYQKTPYSDTAVPKGI